MFSLFKSDPVKKLRKEYYKRLEEGMNAQRNGDIETYSNITAEAEDILKQIKALEGDKEKV